MSSQLHRVSSGLFNCSCEIIRLSKAHGNLDLSEIKLGLSAFNQNLVESSYSFLEAVNLISFSIEQKLVVNKNDLPNEPLSLYRLLLSRYLHVYRPVWLARLVWGVKSAINDSSIDMQHCLREANLLDLNDYFTASWWLQFIESPVSYNKLESGLIGEFLSVQFEFQRIGRMPERVSADSSNKGFDVLSWQHEGKDSVNKLIEVKSLDGRSSRNLIFLTRHEWETAMANQDTYELHIWLLDKKQNEGKLHILSVHEMQTHVPQDSFSGHGKFELAQIRVEEILRTREIVSTLQLVGKEIDTL